jgi:KDO2-lipid IV(A) lauroyltransferase
MITTKQLQHIFEYILFKIFIILFSLLPYKVSCKLAVFIISKISRFFSANKVAKKNLQMVFSNFKQEKIAEITLGVWKNLALNIVEFIHFSNMDQKELAKNIKIIGKENISPYIDSQNKKPVLFYTAHYSNWELCNLMVSNLGFKFNAIYRAANNNLIDKKITLMRTKNKSITMHKKGPVGAKTFIKAFRDNQAGGLLIDQKLTEGIKVPFFNKEALTSKFIVSIAKKYQIDIIPAHTIRDDAGGLSVEFEAAHKYEDIKNLSDKQALALLNKNIENWIKKEPKQWFWVHNRWDN